MKPKRNTTVLYKSPRGAQRTCAYQRAHDTHNGIWWELKDLANGTIFRARPGACVVSAK